jgi:surfeit locus 1 family protein
MSLSFRPLLGFTAFMVPMFALLVGLGFWQLERLQWKLGLIAEMSRNIHAAPISIDRALAMGIPVAQYRSVELSGRFLNDRESYAFGTGPRGVAVYHVLTPLMLDDGRIFLVDRGIVPPELRLATKRAAGELTGEQRVIGVLRTPDKPGAFTPAPDLTQRIWFARDVAGISAANHIRLAAPIIVEADAAPNPGGWPKGGQTVIALPNDHLQYAITWFLLAGALVVIYFAYHRTRGRLTV